MLLSFSSLQKQFEFEDSEQDFVEILIEFALNQVELLIGRKLELKERIAYFDGGMNRLFLPCTPLITASVFEDKTRAFLDESKLDQSEYFIDENQGVIELYESRFLPGKKTIKVIYTAGYTEENLPGIIKKAISEIVLSAYSKNIDRAYGKKSISSVNGTSVTYDFEMNFETKKNIEKLRFMNL